MHGQGDKKDYSIFLLFRDSLAGGDGCVGAAYLQVGAGRYLQAAEWGSVFLKRRARSKWKRKYKEKCPC